MPEIPGETSCVLLGRTVRTAAPWFWGRRKTVRAALYLVGKTVSSTSGVCERHPVCCFGMLNWCVSSAATSMAMQRPTVADVKKAVAPAIALANVLITAPAFAEGTGEVRPAGFSGLPSYTVVALDQDPRGVILEA